MKARSAPPVFITSARLAVAALLLALTCVAAHAKTHRAGRAHAHDCDNQHSFLDVEKHLEKLQDVLDDAVGRGGLVGNVAWLTSMSMYFWNVARKPAVANVCEVGFGCGHSSTIFLASSSKTKVVSFDLFPQTAADIDKDSEMGSFNSRLPVFQRAGLQYLASAFGGRHSTVPGNSSVTIPAYAVAHPDFKCDLIYVDGSHQEEATLVDIQNFRALSHADTLVLIDDVDYAEVKAAVARAVKQKTLASPIECIHGETTINRRFGPPASLYPDLGSGKKFCLTTYVHTRV